MLDNILKILGIAWSVIFFVAAAAFFFGGQWQDWSRIKAHVMEDINNPQPELDSSQFVKVGEKIQLRSNRGFLYGNGGERDEKAVLLTGSANSGWEIERGK